VFSGEIGFARRCMDQNILKFSETDEAENLQRRDEAVRYAAHSSRSVGPIALGL
jgi:hypothetical protein